MESVRSERKPVDAKSGVQATSERSTSGAPELPWAAVRNFSCASLNGTLTYLTLMFGRAAWNLEISCLNFGASLVASLVSQKVTSPDAWLVSWLTSPPPPPLPSLPPPQALSVTAPARPSASQPNRLVCICPD